LKMRNQGFQAMRLVTWPPVDERPSAILRKRAFTNLRSEGSAWLLPAWPPPTPGRRRDRAPRAAAIAAAISCHGIFRTSLDLLGPTVGGDGGISGSRLPQRLRAGSDRERHHRRDGRQRRRKPSARLAASWRSIAAVCADASRDGFLPPAWLATTPRYIAS
jgi:hypothetical protein